VTPWLESLEDRLAPAGSVINVPAGNTMALIADINLANTITGGATLVLGGGTYMISAVDNFWYGPNGLPAIDNNVTIQGTNHSIIERDPTAGTPNFRLFFVSGGLQLTANALPAGTLELDNVTLEGGVAQGGNASSGGGGLGAGGAIFNQGTLILNGVTLTDNQAIGGKSGDFADVAGGGGGGIGSNADNTGNGGGFGPTHFQVNNNPTGGAGGAGSGGSAGGGGGGAGFTSNGTKGNNTTFGPGGGVSGLGGTYFQTPPNNGDGGDGGFGATPLPTPGGGTGGDGGDFGNGGKIGLPNAKGGPPGGGGGGAVGGGGGEGVAGGGGSGGFGGGAGASDFFLNGGGTGGFGGGGGTGRDNSGLSNPPGGTAGFGAGNGGDSTGGGGAGMGGALFNMYGTVTTINTTFTGNTATGGSGGIDGNGGSGFGGAIFNLNGTVTLIYTTVAGNTVVAGAAGTKGGSAGDATGGGVYTLGDARNFAPPATAATGNFNLDNSLVGANTGGLDFIQNAFFIINSANLGGNTNLVQTHDVNQGSGTKTTAPGVITLDVVNPNLTALGNFGGQTQTMAELLTSPGIGQANPAIAGVTLPTVDQRGFPRPGAKSGFLPDLGAYQLQDSVLNVPSPASVVYNSAGLTVPVTGTVTAFGQPAVEGQVTFTLQGTSVTAGPATVNSGIANSNFSIPATVNAGTYNIQASYTDPAVPPLYTNSSLAAPLPTLQIVQANSSITVSPSSVAFNPTSEVINVSATVSSTNGGTPNGGTVVFTINGVSSGAATVSNGMVFTSVTLTGNAILAAGSYPSEIGGSYSDSRGDYASTSGNGPLSVIQDSTTTMLTSTSVSSTFNSTTAQPVTLTATVSSSVPVNEGVVTFTVVVPGGTDLTATSGQVTGGNATATLMVPPEFPSGTYTITSAYADSAGNYGPSNGTPNGRLMVNSADSAISADNVTASFSTADQTVTLTAHITSGDGGVVNEGVVSFNVAGIGTAQAQVTNANPGVATATITVPGGTARGQHAITVTYADSNTNNFGGSSGTGELTIAVSDVVVSVQSISAAYSTAPENLLLQATVTDTNGSPGAPVSEGTVTFTLTDTHGNVIGSSSPAEPLSSSGVATGNFTLPAGTPGGSYTITAVYADSPAGNYNGNQGTGTFTSLPDEVSVALNDVATFYNSNLQSVPVTATLTNDIFPASPVTSGSVLVTLVNPHGASVTATGQVTVGSPSTATATLQIPPTIAAGTYTLTARYTDVTNSNGGTNFVDDLLDFSAHLIVKTANTSVAVVNTSYSFNSGPQTVFLNAHVTSTNGGPVSEGTVTFQLGTLTTSGPVSDGLGTAMLVLPAGFARGVYTVQATYADSTNVNGTTNYAAFPTAGNPPASGTFTVVQADSQVHVVPQTVGFNTVAQPLTLTATVTSNAGGKVTGGVVTFSVAGLGPFQAQVNTQGVASTTITLPAQFPAGTFTISATFSDPLGNYVSNTGTAPLTVTPAPTNLAVSPVSVNFSNNGQNVTLSAAVSNPQGIPVIEGEVTFFLLGAFQTPVQVSNGVATLTIQLPGGVPAGTSSIDAGYSDPKGNYTGSTGSSVLQINQTSTGIQINSLDINPNLFGNASVTVHATVSGAGSGQVVFSIAGVSKSTGVNGDSTATATLSIPNSALGGGLGVSASFSDPSGNLGGSSQSKTANLNFWDLLLQATVTFNADGSQSLQLNFFNLLLLFVFDSSGAFSGSTLGGVPLFF
jgi:hypothetical protein